MRIRVVLVVAGVLTMAYAAAGALADPAFDPVGVLIFLAGVLIGHDAVWMLAVLAGGATITRLVPRQNRPVVRAAAISATALTFVAFPLLFGAGRTPAYGRNLAVVLLLLTAATLLTCWWRARRKDSERPGDRRPRPADR